MGQKEIGGPVATVVIAVIVLLVIGFGFFYLNKDSMGKGAVPNKLGRPGVMPKWADPKMGPFPSGSGPGGVQTPGGVRTSGAGAAPPNVKIPGQ